MTSKRRTTSRRRQTHKKRKRAADRQISVLEQCRVSVQADPENTETVLCAGEILLRHGMGAEIIGVIGYLEPKYPFDSEIRSRRFSLLLAFSHIERGDLTAAESILDRCRQISDAGLDALYLRTQIYLKMREFDKAVSTGQQFLEQSAQPGGSVESGYWTSDEDGARIADALGVALAELKRYDEAQEAYERAIRFDSGSQSPYLHLARLHQSLGQRAEAAEVVKKGLGLCRQVNELRLIRKALRPRPSVSACMIVKNEEDLLPGCLESIRDWVDEIVLVDTGSEDRTMDIAREYGARIFEQPWTGDFSSHRNYSIEQASGDWIFIIDADERIVEDDVLQITSWLAREDCSLLAVDVLNVYGADEDRVTYAKSVRFFRRKLSLRYYGIVHNELRLPGDVPVHHTRVRLKHLGYDLAPEKMQAKFQRTRELLKQQLSENPDDVFALFNYAELHRGFEPTMTAETAHEVLHAAGRVVEITDPKDADRRHLHLMCLNQMTAAYLALEDHTRALQCCQEALRITPDYLDALIHLGVINYGLGRYPEAIDAFEQYLSSQHEFARHGDESPMILSHPDSRALAHNNLGILSELVGDAEGARRHYESALEVNPSYHETASRLGRLYERAGRPDDAVTWYRHQLEHARPTPQALLGLASIHRQQGRLEEALELLIRAEALFPDDVSVQVAGATLLTELGRPSEAGQHWQKASDLAGNDPEINRQLGDLCFQYERYAEARQHYEIAMASVGADPEILNNLGNCCFKLEQLEQAETRYREALEADPDNGLAWRNLGLTLARQGRSQEAVVALEKCLETDSGAPEVALLVADQHRISGDFEKALRWYETVLRRQPESAAALFGLSECYLLMGHRDSAVLGYQKVLELAPDCQPALERLTQLAPTAKST